jgi:hypothetical protein
MKKEARLFLKNMIKSNGFIADGLYEEHPRFWRSNNQHSARLMDLGLLGYLKREQYIRRDSQGRYVITPKGVKFAQPWWKRWFELS